MQHIDKAVDVQFQELNPWRHLECSTLTELWTHKVIREQHVFMSQKIQETVQVPQVEVIDEIIQVLQAMRRQVPVVQRAQMTVEILQR